MSDRLAHVPDAETLLQASSTPAPSGESEPVKEPHYKPKLCLVSEIFGPTIQGEGQMCGRQTMFIRFAGCDYRCTMCDSLHAVLPSLFKHTARKMDAAGIVAELESKAKHCKTVTFSGGNPLMWDLSELCETLANRGWDIAVETQGTLFKDWLKWARWITVSPKGPGMGERFDEEQFQDFLRKVDEVAPHSNTSLKVVLFDQRDIEFAKSINLLTEYSYPFYLSLGNPLPPPATSDGKREYLAHLEVDLLHKMKVLWEDVQNEPELVEAIFLPQLHVLLWGNEQGR